MKRKGFFVLCLLLCAAMISGCTGAGIRLPNFAPAEEQRLIIYTSHREDVYRPIVREFEERTGIWVDVVSGGTSELLKRIVQEADVPQADILFGDGVDTLETLRDHFASCCIAPDSIGEQFLSSDSRWAPFSALPVVLIYNTKLVDPTHLAGWQDLGRPEFRGKIAYADPEKSGSSFTALMTMYLALGDQAPEMLRHALDGKLLTSSGDVPPAVADGSCLVGITLEENALRHIEAGASIGIVYPNDGTCCIPDGTAILAGAPHPDNARLFAAFTMSREVQSLLSSGLYRRPVRTDVQPIESLPVLDDLTLLEYDALWAAKHRNTLLTLWDRAQEGVDAE